MGDALVVLTVATVVLAHFHVTADVWLNVVLNAALARVRSAAALPKELHNTAPDGKSAATNALNVGVAAPPEVGPAKTKLAV
jgi:hypothetical protein